MGDVPPRYTLCKENVNAIHTVYFYFVLEEHDRSFESHPHEGNRSSQEGLLSCDGLVRHVTAVT